MKKVLSFDIGGTNLRCALINENFEIEKVLRESTLHGTNEVFLNQIYEMIEKFNIKDNNITAISFGVPGKVRWDGYICELPNVGIKDISLGDYINAKYSLTTYVKNDAEMAGLGEATLGAGKDYKNVYFFTISTGFGGALIRDKKIVVPDDEIGHTLVKYHGEYHEFEKLFSGTGIVLLSHLNGLEVKDAFEFFTLKEKGNDLAIKVYKVWLDGIVNIIEFVTHNFKVDIVVLSGGVIKSSQFFMNELKERVKDVKIEVASFSQNAGLIGSAYYGFNPQD